MIRTDRDPITQQKKERNRTKRRRLGVAALVGGVALTGGSLLTAVHATNELYSARDRINATYSHYTAQELESAKSVTDAYIRTAEDAAKNGDIKSLADKVNGAELQYAYTLQRNQEVYITALTNATQGADESILATIGLMGGVTLLIVGETLYLRNKPTRKQESIRDTSKFTIVQ